MHTVTIVHNTDPTDRHEMDVTPLVGTSNYDRFCLCRKVDFERYHIDSEDADAAHAAHAAATTTKPKEG